MDHSGYVTVQNHVEEDDDANDNEDVDGDHDWHFRYNRRLACFSNPVSSLTFSRDGRYFVSGTGSGDVKIWETVRWSEAAKLKCNRREEPRAIVISPAQRWLVTAYQSALMMFDCKPPWRMVDTMKAPLDPATKEPSEWFCIAFSPGMAEVDHPRGSTGQDNHLAAFSTRHLSVIDYSGGWGIDAPKRTRSLLHASRPTSLAYTADGWWLVCGFECGQIQVWNAFSLTLDRTLVSHTGKINDISASPRSAAFESRFVSCGADQTLRVWHTCGWILEQICPDTRCDYNGIRTCAFSSTGNWLVSVANELCVWRVCVTRQGKVLLRAHQRMTAACGAEGLRAAAFCSINDAIAVGSRDGVLGLWTKLEGAPPDLVPLDAAGQIHQREKKVFSREGNVEAWSLDPRILPRPMNRITPEGIRPRVASSKTVDWFQRNNLRSLSMVSLAARNGVAARMSAASAGGRLAVSSSVNSAMMRVEPESASQGSGARSSSNSSTPDLGRWRSSVSYESALSSLTGEGIGGSSNGTALVRKLPSISISTNSGSTSDLQALSSDFEEECPSPSPMRKSMNHACRGLVRRISVDPLVIQMPTKTD